MGSFSAKKNDPNGPWSLRVQWKKDTCIAQVPFHMFFTIIPNADTRVERNALMSRVYPKLRDFSQEQGYEFQVVDMRWGVHDPCTDDHMIGEISQKELQACQALSTGPNFVVRSVL